MEHGRNRTDKVLGCDFQIPVFNGQMLFIKTSFSRSDLSKICELNGKVHFHFSSMEKARGKTSKQWVTASQSLLMHIFFLIPSDFFHVSK